MSVTFSTGTGAEDNTRVVSAGPFGWLLMCDSSLVCVSCRSSLRSIHSWVAFVCSRFTSGLGIVSVVCTPPSKVTTTMYCEDLCFSALLSVEIADNSRLSDDAYLYRGLLLGILVACYPSEGENLFLNCNCWRTITTRHCCPNNHGTTLCRWAFAVGVNRLWCPSCRRAPCPLVNVLWPEVFLLEGQRAVVGYDKVVDATGVCKLRS
ncbi:unnamed protein product [Ectocarpus sp. 4 AP-2014]